MHVASKVLKTSSSGCSRLQTADVKIAINEVSKPCGNLKAILDNGSTHSYIRKSTAQRLNLKKLGTEEFTVGVFGHKEQRVVADIVEAFVEVYYKQSGQCKLKRIVLITSEAMCSDIIGRELTTEQQRVLEEAQLPLADRDIGKSGSYKVDLLVGLDYYYDLAGSQVLRLAEGIIVLDTLLGYVMCSSAELKVNKVNLNIRTNLCRTQTNMFRLTSEEEQTSLNRLVDLSIIGIKEEEAEMSPVLERFENTVRKEDDRVVVPLPWIERRRPRLMSNFYQSFRRLQTTYSKYKRQQDSDVMEKCQDIINEQVKLGIIEKVCTLGTVGEIEDKLQSEPSYYDSVGKVTEDSTVCYLPHHVVIKPSTQKPRLVYDASAKPCAEELSLNDCLETGPSLIKSLATILIRFRLQKTAFVADVEKAFLQIKIKRIDQDALRFLWTEDDEVIVYRFMRLPFGLTSSPFVLAATMKHLFMESRMDEKLLNRILGAFYVDDLVDSVNTNQEAINIKECAESALDAGSMRLRKWNSNNITIRSLFSEDNEDTSESEVVLGLCWNTRTDKIKLNFTRILDKLSEKHSKSELYSVLAQLFDPMGLVSPYVLMAKYLLQDTCQAKTEWNKPLPEDIAVKWSKWKQQLHDLPLLELDRWVGCDDAISTELHGFCDASEKAYAAVVYIVTRTSTGVQSRLLMSKARVAPAKSLSIARLELCAAVLLTRLMSSLKTMLHDVNISKCKYYTDSMNVLQWIRSEHFTWPVFVANRIKQILLASELVDWNYVSTLLNAADVASRGAALADLWLKYNWFEGPKFLVTGESPCEGRKPQFTPLIKEDCINTVCNLAQTVSPKVCGLTSIIPSTYTNQFSKLIGTTVAVLRATKKFLALISKPCLSHAPTESKASCLEAKAELLWVQSIQGLHYVKEIMFCKVKPCNKTVPELVHHFSLYWDDRDSLLRCYNRQCDANLRTASVEPALLPKDSQFTKMKIQQVHARWGHVGVRQTLAILRSEYWVPQGRRVVTKVLRQCQLCRRLTHPTFALPPPPPLPVNRICESRPYATIGVDYCGPLKLIRSQLAYVLIFTCASTRAVHFEAVPSMSVNDFLMAFKRMIARRGVPGLIVSDNAKTYKCVAKNLRRIFDSPKLKRYCSDSRIEWRFYTERSPWMGGFIERVVQLFKRTFRKLISNTRLNFREFSTLTTEAEGIVNSRPLTYSYERVEEGEVLTPSDLVHGYKLTDLPPLSGISLSPKSKYKDDMERIKVMEKVKDQMWKRWSTDYMQMLAQRSFDVHKKKGTVREPVVGEIVLALISKGERLPRRSWNLARVEEVKRSARDGCIRTVVVRVPQGKDIKGGLYRRSPSFLVPLEDTIEDKSSHTVYTDLYMVVSQPKPL